MQQVEGIAGVDRAQDELMIQIDRFLSSEKSVGGGFTKTGADRIGGQCSFTQVLALSKRIFRVYEKNI